MRVVARLGWEDLAWGTPLARAFASGRLPESVGGAREAVPDRPEAPAAFLRDLLAEMTPEHRDAWKPLEVAGARAVVTGQQPGCAGGPLLVLYKVATAVSLARRLSTAFGRPVVPIFWNATDDEDFDEISTVGWPHADGLAYLELPRATRRAAGWVGDLPAAGDVAVVRAARELSTDAERAALDGCVPEDAADHGAWVARWLARVFPELAVLDARSAALRTHGAPFFARWLERRERVQAAVAEGVRRIEEAGHARTLDPASLESGLFHTGARRREKAGRDPEPLRRALATDPTSVSPNVVLRPLLQDELLPVVAQVVGPAEIGYLLELRPARAVLGVPEPALVPRLTQTVLPAEGFEAARNAGLEPSALVGDPAAALAAVARAGGEASRAALGRAFDALETSLEALPLAPAARDRAARRLRAIAAGLADEMDAAARDALLARTPRLSGLAAMLRPRGRAQERVVAALWLVAQQGRVAAPRLVELAAAHLDACRRSRPDHALVVL